MDFVELIKISQVPNVVLHQPFKPPTTVCVKYERKTACMPSILRMRIAIFLSRQVHLSITGHHVILKAVRTEEKECADNEDDELRVSPRTLIHTYFIVAP